MKPLAPVLAVLLLATTAFAQPADADSLYAEIQQQLDRRPPEGFPQQKRMLWYNISHDAVSRLAEKFIAQHPSDARRWEVLARFATLERVHANDTEAEAFRRRQAEARQEILTSPDAPENVVSQAYIAEINPLLRGDGRASTEQLARCGQVLAEFARRLPQAGGRAYIESQYLQALKRTDEKHAEAYAQKLAQDPNKGVAELGRKTAAAIAFRREPISIKRTAFDGREVDFTKLRGKVVLIDFWATWCVPCMEQMPEIKRVYEKYKDQGFVVIGVTDDIPPRDPANPRGSEKTPEQLKAFLEKENMPWPQIWDMESTAVRRGPKELLVMFDVHSLPTTLLLDKQGRIITADNHGDKLEANVRKALGL